VLSLFEGMICPAANIQKVTMRGRQSPKWEVGAICAGGFCLQQLTPSQLRVEATVE
jgi:hypothetical protein